MLATAAAGCSGLSSFTDSVKSDAGWFQAPLALGARSDGSAAVANKNFDLGPRGPVAPEELVNSDGSCAPAVMAASASPAMDSTGSAAAIPVEQPILGGIALGMTECDTVRRAGAPSNINIGAGPAGNRNTVVTYTSGPWPGIYTFADGRLKEISAAPVLAKPAKPAPRKPATATRQRSTPPTQIR